MPCCAWPCHEPGASEGRNCFSSCATGTLQDVQDQEEDQELGCKHLGEGGGTGRLLGPHEDRRAGSSALGSR